MSVSRHLMSSVVKLDLGGIFPPIATPFESSGKLSLKKLQHNFKLWSSKGFRGYVVMGSNGEFPFLSEAEKIELVKACRQHIPKEQLLIVGAGCEGTDATINLTQKLAAENVDAVLVHTPCFYKNLMTSQALENHYRQVAKSSPVPVILYNVPPNTGIDMTVETVQTLSTEPNIIGLKDSSGNLEKLEKIMKATDRESFQVLAGSAGFLLSALRMGCVGGVVAAGNMLGDQVVKLCQLHSSNSTAEADSLQKSLVNPNLAITRKFGVPALKHMMDKTGYYGGPVRSPLLPLTPEQIDEIENTFRNEKLL